MKFVSLLASLVFSAYKMFSKGRTDVMLELAFEQMRKFSLLFCGVLAASLVFVSGLIISLVAGSYSYDYYAISGVASPSTLLLVGLATMLVSASTLTVLFLRRTWGLSKTGHRVESLAQERKQVSPLENALSVLILDLMKERSDKKPAAAASAQVFTKPEPLRPAAENIFRREEPKMRTGN